MKQKPGKFANLDRAHVISALEEHYGIKLKKVSPRHKWLRDESDRNWWVLGGRDDWHGIPEEMMEDERQAHLEGRLVIAEKRLGSLVVFEGPLSRLVSARGKLYRATQTTGDYQFTVEVKGDAMRCVQASDVALRRITSIPFSDEQKARTRQINKLKKEMSAMSPEERAVLLDALAEGLSGDDGELGD